jgi:hypothetical protein
MSIESRAFCFPRDHVSHQLLESAWFAEPGPAFIKVMYDCGQALAQVLLESLQDVPKSICVMSQAIDADGIAKGVSDFLVAQGVQVRHVCLWNQMSIRFEGGEEIAPILRSYTEAGYTECEQLVAVQSFLGLGTVLKTNITANFARIEPELIHVLAPAMPSSLQDSLRPQFPASINERFRYHTFVYDSDLDTTTGELRPGIGGLPAERMGLHKDTTYLGFPLSVVDLMKA